MSIGFDRSATWAGIAGPWDVVIIGGGITGAGILREARRAGLRALLLEQRDFAWGTSSRSSKLVHGGLRYLREGLLGLVWESVRERERLIKDAPGLVDPLHFMLATYSGDTHGKFSYGVALAVYDLIAGVWKHTWYDTDGVNEILPALSNVGLGGGFRYYDASTDDARLVLRVLHEAVAAGGVVLNHAEAEELLRDGENVSGVRVKDRLTGQTADVAAKVVVNATGAWADKLRAQVDEPKRMRPLRGSHIVFDRERLPAAEAIALQHPVDRRVMFVFPWQGVTVVGTTDLDHPQDLNVEPSISAAEVSYLMAALELRFPELHLTVDDIVASWAGVRPVVSSGKADPSAETRDHVVWDEKGLVTVTGGKLTTFRIIAHDAMLTILKHLPEATRGTRGDTVLDVAADDQPGLAELPAQDRSWVLGRYGAQAGELLAAAAPGELEHIGASPFLWAELRWAARNEWVAHLDDLLLRRLRIGMLMRDGASEHMARIRAICQPELGWDDARWAQEEADYLALARRCYGIPEDVPDWRPLLEARKTA